MKSTTYTLIVRTYLKGECIHGQQLRGARVTEAEVVEILATMQLEMARQGYLLGEAHFDNFTHSFGARMGGRQVEIFALGYAA